MIPAGFDYARASSLDDALRLLARHGAGAKVLAGGHSLIPLLKLRLARPERLIDIGRLRELRGIRRLPDGRLAVGALTTYRDLLASEDIAHYGLMRDVLPGIGDVQVRNRGTIGGAIAHADPASDMAAVLLALDAELVLRSVRGERRVRTSEFLLGSFHTALAPDELLVEIVLPGGLPNASSAYRSLEARASGYPIAGAATVLVLAPDDTVAYAAVALTGVADIAYRASGAEAALTGKPLSAEAFAAAAAHATDGRTVNGDLHADREYRTAMAAVVVRRSLEDAAARFR